MEILKRLLILLCICNIHCGTHGLQAQEEIDVTDIISTETTVHDEGGVLSLQGASESGTLNNANIAFDNELLPTTTIESQTHEARDTVFTTSSIITENNNELNDLHNENILLNKTANVGESYSEHGEECPSECLHKCSINKTAHDNSSYEEPHSSRCKCNCTHKDIPLNTTNDIREVNTVAQEKMEVTKMTYSETTVQDEGVLSLQRTMKPGTRDMTTKETNIAFNKELHTTTIESQTHEATDTVFTISSYITENSNTLSGPHNANELFNRTGYIIENYPDHGEECPSECTHKCSINKTAHDNSSYEEPHSSRCKCNCTDKDVHIDTGNSIRKMNTVAQDEIDVTEITYSETTAQDKGVLPLQRAMKSKTLDMATEEANISFNKDLPASTVESQTYEATDTISETSNYITETNNKLSDRDNENKLLNRIAHITESFLKDRNKCPTECLHKCSINKTAHDNSSYEEPHSSRCKCNCSHENIPSDTTNYIREINKETSDFNEKNVSDITVNGSYVAVNNLVGQLTVDFDSNNSTNLLNENVSNSEKIIETSDYVKHNYSETQSNGDCSHNFSENILLNATEKLNAAGYKKPKKNDCENNCQNESKSHGITHSYEDVNEIAYQKLIREELVNYDTLSEIRREKQNTSDCIHNCSNTNTVNDRVRVTNTDLSKSLESVFEKLLKATEYENESNHEHMKNVDQSHFSDESLPNLSVNDKVSYEKHEKASYTTNCSTESSLDVNSHTKGNVNEEVGKHLEHLGVLITDNAHNPNVSEESDDLTSAEKFGSFSVKNRPGWPFSSRESRLNKMSNCWKYPNRKRLLSYTIEIVPSKHTHLRESFKETDWKHAFFIHNINHIFSSLTLKNILVGDVGGFSTLMIELIPALMTGSSEFEEDTSFNRDPSNDVNIDTDSEESFSQSTDNSVKKLPIEMISKLGTKNGLPNEQSSVLDELSFIIDMENYLKVKTPFETFDDISLTHKHESRVNKANTSMKETEKNNEGNDLMNHVLPIDSNSTHFSNCNVVKPVTSPNVADGTTKSHEIAKGKVTQKSNTEEHFLQIRRNGTDSSETDNFSKVNLFIDDLLPNSSSHEANSDSDFKNVSSHRNLRSIPKCCRKKNTTLFYDNMNSSASSIRERLSFHSGSAHNFSILGGTTVLNETRSESPGKSEVMPEVSYSLNQSLYTKVSSDGKFTKVELNDDKDVPLQYMSERPDLPEIEPSSALVHNQTYELTPSENYYYSGNNAFSVIIANITHNINNSLAITTDKVMTYDEGNVSLGSDSLNGSWSSNDNEQASESEPIDISDKSSAIDHFYKIAFQNDTARISSSKYANDYSPIVPAPVENITSTSTVTGVTSLRTKDDFIEEAASGDFVLQESYMPLKENASLLPNSLLIIATARNNGSSNKMRGDTRENDSDQIGSEQTQAALEILRQPILNVSFKNKNNTYLNIKEISDNFKSYGDLNEQRTMTTKDDTSPAEDKSFTTEKRARRRRRFIADKISQYKEGNTEQHTTIRGARESSVLLSARKRSATEAKSTSSDGYFYTVTIPAFFALLVGIVVCCVLLRPGGWLCRLFREDRVPEEQQDERKPSAV